VDRSFGSLPLASELTTNGFQSWYLEPLLHGKIGVANVRPDKEATRTEEIRGMVRCGCDH